MPEPPIVGDPATPHRTEETVIAENLKRLLDGEAMQAKQLAGRIGVSAQAVSQWLTGQAKPSNKRLVQIAQHLKVEVDDLVRDSAPPLAMAIRRCRLNASANPEEQLIEFAIWNLPYEWASKYGWSSPQKIAAIEVQDSNLEPTVRIGEELFVDLAWQAITLSGLYLLDYGGFPHFRWCRVVKPDSVSVSDLSIEQEFAPRELKPHGRVVGRVGGAPIRR